MPSIDYVGLYRNPRPGGNAPGTTVAGAPPFNYSPSAGGIPQVPYPASTQAQAIAGNQQNLPAISTLATGTGQLNAQLGALPYQQNLPNYANLLGGASNNALSLIGGTIPSDINRNLIQGAAERGIATGMPGAPASNASYLQALGLTGLGLQQQGLQNFGSLMNLTPTGPQFNPASLYVSPESYQQAQAAANLYNAAPIPSYAQQSQFSALSQGLNRGQIATAPQGPQTQSADLVSSILQRYAPTATGQPGQMSQYDPANDFFPGLDNPYSTEVYPQVSPEESDFLLGYGDNLYSGDYGGEM